MNIENVDVGCPKLLERLLHGDMERLCAVACERILLLNVILTTFVTCRELWEDVSCTRTAGQFPTDDHTPS